MAACDFKYLETLSSSTEAPFFVDQYGRCLLLHGVNLSGASKLPATPYPECLYPDEDAFWSPESEFVGRPFATDEAEGHFQRLKHYGVTLLRLVVMWEAIETSPAVYNARYLDYLEAILRLASDNGLLIIVDFHQDCWSRFTGGSGAPLWTFEVAGLDPRHFVACGAALLQSPSLEEYSEAGTLWATNYTKFAVNTMFTLFFAGEVFAPKALYRGENVGLFLRKCYLACVEEMARRFKQISGVIGFDVMNEPHHGFIGMHTLQKFNEDVLLHLGEMPSALQSMKLAAGIPQNVPVYTTSWPKPTRITSFKVLNCEAVTGWLPHREDVWQQHNVWSTSGYHDDYFSCFPEHHSRAGHKVNFNDDFYVPFLHECQQVIKRNMPRAWLFIEPIPNTMETPLPSFSGIGNICYAPHWYDLKALFEKKFSSHVTMNVQALSRGSRNLFAHTYFGASQAIDNYAKQYASIFEDSSTQFPRLVGETGIPFDMNHYYQAEKASANAKNDYRVQEQMLDIMCTAMERNLLSYTLWNYTPENRARQGGGDLWNGEDFSIYSQAEADEMISSTTEATKFPSYAGCRAAAAWIRPTATKIAGVPLYSRYNLRKKTYTLEFIPTQSEPEICRQTEVFIPLLCFRDGRDFKVTYSGVEASWKIKIEQQTLIFIHEVPSALKGKKCTLVVEFASDDAGSMSSIRLRKSLQADTRDRTEPCAEIAPIESPRVNGW